MTNETLATNSADINALYNSVAYLQSQVENIEGALGSSITSLEHKVGTLEGALKKSEKKQKNLATVCLITNLALFVLILGNIFLG